MKKFTLMVALCSSILPGLALSSVAQADEYDSLYDHEQIAITNGNFSSARRLNNLTLDQGSRRDRRMSDVYQDRDGFVDSNRAPRYRLTRSENRAITAFEAGRGRTYSYRAGFRDGYRSGTDSNDLYITNTFWN